MKCRRRAAVLRIRLRLGDTDCGEALLAARCFSRSTIGSEIEIGISAGGAMPRTVFASSDGKRALI